MQKAWNSHYKTFGTDFYTLQAWPGDMVVSWSSSTSLKGATTVKLPLPAPYYHVTQANHSFWQETVYMILTLK